MGVQATSGLIGGMSWESSAHSSRLINEAARARRGPTASARCLMWSFDFSQIEVLQHAGRWDELAERLADAGKALERGGADFLVLCTNTMHRLAGELQAAVDLPLLHIADPTGEAIKAAGLRKVGLLGTAFTMEHAFYRGRLEERFGLEVVVPGEADRAVVHRVIYDELVAGVVRDESRQAYREVIARLAGDGAEGIILGCTEIMLLVGQSDSPVPVFDTTTLHALAAVDRALGS